MDKEQVWKDDLTAIKRLTWTCQSLAGSLVAAEKERDEARDVARKMLRIARAHGAKPFGLEMAPWLKGKDEATDPQH